jgi:hypothetical protein
MRDRQLVEMFVPEGGVLLDPFLGGIDGCGSWRAQGVVDRDGAEPDRRSEPSRRRKGHDPDIRVTLRSRKGILI